MTKIIEEKKEINDMERKVIEQDDGGILFVVWNWVSGIWSGLTEPVQRIVILVFASLVVCLFILILFCLNKRCK